MKSERLLDTFLALVQCDNPSGAEGPVIDYIRSLLLPLGAAFEQDEAGNLLARLPGVGEPLLLNAHTDSVTPCIGVRPIVAGGVVRSSGDTVLGADDLAGVAAILEGVRRLRDAGAPHRSLELLFTSQEEIGLVGAAAFDYRRLHARHGFTLDANGAPGGMCLGAPSQDNLAAVVIGRAAHAGIAPEEGISAIRVAAEAIAAMPLGRIDPETTANIGVIRGGEATNIVTPRVELRGEARSHSPDKLAAQIEAMTAALHDAAARHMAQTDIHIEPRYRAYRLQEDEPVVQYATAALHRLGLQPIPFIGGGGSDVNIFAEHGLRVVNLSLGYEAIHSVDEHIAVADLERAAQLVAELIRVQPASAQG